MSSILNGKPLAGISVDPHKFQGVSTLNQLEDYGLDRPSAVDQLKQADTKHDRRNREAQQLRATIQRTFDAARKRRAEVYSAYIEKVETIGVTAIPGGTPAMTIYLPSEETKVTDDGRTLVVQYNSLIIALDGETQAEARFLLRDRKPETGHNPIAVTAYFNKDADFAQQILHDYNAYGVKVSEKLLASVNHTGPLSKAILDACNQVGIGLTDLNRKGNVSNKKTVAAYSQVMSAVTGYVMNGQALSAGAAKWFQELNRPASQIVINKQTVNATVAFLKAAHADPDIGKMNALIWQVAGAAVANGREAKSLDWDAALVAYDKTKVKGRGGPRMPMAGRLQAIADAI